MRPSEVWATNVEASFAIARWCQQRDRRLVFVYSDFVFAGRPGGGYTEEDVPDPVNAYGRGKATVEKAVREVPDSLVVRSSLLYGRVLGTPNLLDHMLSHALDGTSLRVTIARSGRRCTSPTPARPSSCSSCRAPAVWSSWQGRRP